MARQDRIRLPVRVRVWARRLPALTATVLLAAGLAACGSSGSSTSAPAPGSSSSATTGAASTATTTTTTTTTVGTASSGTATPQAVAGPPTCQTRSLKLSLLSGGGAAGTAYTYYALTNTGPTACSMIGYPGVSILDSRGHIVQHPATRGAAIPVPVHLVTLRSGQRAKFLVNSTDTIPSPGCPHAYHGTTLQVFPPNQRSAILLPGNATFCNLRVGPVQSAG